MMKLSTPRLQRNIAETGLLRIVAEESYGLDGTL
jgi:hypothetical protein